ncbi:alpha/beta-hydrolase [Aspergillus costaricaensis CBS 115574]|uniref:Alpha/beta-hydrolase n=1 Tax=Aspergillus costaricaensis CBS 115574 TaxID=1448317 RepID=A0ACD1IL79_9EURO|nr:alpha/beta-hydrolase [Aspergillus costaricaensis CBS 115574]RAK90489.1 alpha/beta-hydrolase [Aspergillus costaricaensis CBS 115574]
MNLAEQYLFRGGKFQYSPEGLDFTKIAVTISPRFSDIVLTFLLSQFKISPAAIFKNIVTAALLSSALASASTAHANGKAPCAKVHMMLARGTTESYPGLLGSLTDLTPSYEEGIYNGTAQLKAYVKACPETKVVLFGYSQGAMVVSDMLAGGGDNGTLGNITAPAVDPETGSHIAAVLLYGDPRHMPNQTYNVGDVTATGKYPRTPEQLAALSMYADRLHDYCDDKDGVCDAAGTNLSAHLAYATIWDKVAATWVESMMQK